MKLSVVYIFLLFELTISYARTSSSNNYRYDYSTIDNGMSVQPYRPPKSKIYRRIQNHPGLLLNRVDSLKRSLLFGHSKYSGDIAKIALAVLLVVVVFGTIAFKDASLDDLISRRTRSIGVFDSRQFLDNSETLGTKINNQNNLDYLASSVSQGIEIFKSLYQ